MDDANTPEVEAPTEDALHGNAPESVILTDDELAEAQKNGAKKDAEETGKAAHHALTDGSMPGEPPKNPYHGWDEIQQYAGLLDLGVDAFEAKIVTPSGDEGSIPDEKVYGLLALERNGKNRTPYVKAMMSRLDLSKDDLPGGGPDYTNDMTSISSL